MADKNPELKKALAALLAKRAGSVTTHPEAETLVAYQAGELDATREEELQEHLLLCRECGDLLLELEKIEREERDAGEGEAPAARRRLLPFRRWRRTALGEAAQRTPAPTWPAWAAAGAVAAGLVILLVLPGGGALPLEPYTLSIQGELQDLRGPGQETDVYRFAPGGTFELVLRPQRQVTGRVRVQAFVLRDSQTQRWRPPTDVSQAGSVRIAGQVGSEIVLPAGESILLVVLGRPGKIPETAEIERRLAEASMAQEPLWAAWKVRVSFEEKSGAR